MELSSVAKNLKNIVDTYSTVSTEACLYLIYKTFHVEAEVTSDILIELLEAKLMTANDVTPAVRNYITESFLNTVETQAKVNEYKIEEDEDLNKLTKAFVGTYDETRLKHYSTYVRNDMKVAKALYTFLHLLPSTSARSSALWVKNFRVPVPGHSYRVISKSTAASFSAAGAKYGYGTVCYALLIVVRESINKEENKCYLPALSKFFKNIDSHIFNVAERKQELATKAVRRNGSIN